MKRTLWIFVMGLVIIGSTIVALYVIRKNKALHQYVHPNSQAIMSVSLDDLLLDNIDQLFKRRTADSVASDHGLLDIASWWSAGIGIPAQIHFFTLNDNPLTFFTIQKIKDIEKWETFVKEHMTDTIQIITPSGQPLSFAHLSSGVSTMYDDQYLLLRIAISKQHADNEMSAIWGEKNTWMYVSNFPASPAENQKAHVVYRHTDGTLQLFADLTKGHITLAGDWQLDSNIPTRVQVRVPKVGDHSFLAFWSDLPLAETPFITRFLSSFADIEPDRLLDNSHGYVDLFMSADMTTQRDTVIVYDYDEDFNAIEKKEIQEVTVPNIESVWKGNEQLAGALPEKLFYRFYKQVADSLVLLSTKEDNSFSPAFVVAKSPFQIAVDFKNLPASWADSMLRSLQQRALQIDIETSALNQRMLGITGNIRYEKR